MKTDINSILKDLYKLAPELKKHDQKVRQLISELLKSKPEVKIEQKFINSLKKDLQKEIKLLSEQEESEEQTESDSESPNILKGILGRLLYPFAGGVAATLLIIGVLSYFPLLGNSNQNYDYQIQYTALQEDAFGPLSKIQNNSTGADATAATLSRPQSGGGNPDAMESAMMIEPYMPYSFKYTYNGDPLVLNKEKVSVYRRNTGNISSAPIINLLGNLDFGVLNLENFKNMKVETVQLYQDTPFGYMMNLNFKEGSISLNQNWETWEHLENICEGDPQCYEDNRLTESDIPENKTLINIAESFLEENGVSIEQYGEPQIMKYWEQEIMIARSEGMQGPVYIPEQISVIYPLLIEGKEAINSGGEPYGLDVGINIRHNKVSSINNLRVESFDKSQYDAVSDWNVIEDYIADMNVKMPEQENVVELELTNPEIILMNVWNPFGEKNMHEQLFVPAIKFEIIQNEKTPYYRKHVLIPLVKEMLEENLEERPVIMPLINDTPDISVSSEVEPPVLPTIEPEIEPMVAPGLPIEGSL